jgi:predicted TIM-barrel fold metal-dependent hydrolase
VSTDQLPEGIRVFDSDSHVTEPPDLWTSRVASKWGDDVPHVRTNRTTGVESWFIGDTKIGDAAGTTFAGWKHRPPLSPPTLADATPGSWQPGARLEWLDENGLYRQVLYPNILGFIPRIFWSLDPALQLECVGAYNDFLTDFCAAAPDRLLPITYLPWWDVDASVAELTRCRDRGHRGVLIPWEFEKAGLPPLRADHWEPLLAAAEEAGAPINFHVGFGQETVISHVDDGAPAAESIEEILRKSGGLGIANCIIELLMGRVCARHPALDFVVVESGVGFIPYLLESLDWNFQNTISSLVDPDLELPSTYFRRQVYGTFWFERDVVRIADLYPDNFMFETDYPHATSLSPGPNTIAQSPRDHIRDHLLELPEPVLRRVLQDNAERVYGIAA